MVRVTLRPLTRTQWQVSATGHAGSAAPGHDLVCAGVSTLLQTLLGGCEEALGATVRGDLEAGSCDVIVAVPPRAGSSLTQVMGVFASGFTRLGQAHPHHLVFSLEQRKEAEHHGD